jgi:hypothetical protein
MREVPEMLSLISPADITPELSPVGTWLACDDVPVTRSQADHLAELAPGSASSARIAASSGPVARFARPREREAANLLGCGTQAAVKAGYAGQQLMSNHKFGYTTRIAAVSGGFVGSHPARDPV